MENKNISIVQNNKKMTTKQLIMCALFTALIAVGAFIKIPIPVLPFTLQFLFTMMAGLLMGGEMGAYSVFMYILFGLIGLPIFTEGGGLGYIFKPTFGYIIGFCIASYVTGKIANKESNPTYKRILTANFIGLFIVYSLGMLYYYIICNFVINTPMGVWPLFLYCFILAVPGDILLCILGALLYKRLIPAIKFIR
ncbi:biotin transporter BioY [Clostridium sp.]|uniref:biotin transporter BioY n=1 Tax=Clostridium sp. TaxID=1506 RepID=UPI00284FBF0F|nr:biotin transporter BioY [Clostridium sp.]MDR3595884.1 biotin transporter BioY [Clostridium sp.]